MKTIYFSVSLHCLHISGYLCHFLCKYVLSIYRKSACPFGQLQTKMHFPESPFFKKSLPGAIGQVLMLVPGLEIFIFPGSPHASSRAS